ncbi:hypothetical protein FEM33_17575 [Dyadobacter flavalbus]|uniref:Uncharacterized protein n=1 Tax=Dyadobacter flavalbus TaxID=2579942 RepID=A0A5M8QQH7_9BACT|nr:hypothetical protein [Dyadobacter flavalbus]KAA6438497.1 hypothetical protein FEM33_17575 [Dyadobacter flavalbus]
MRASELAELALDHRSAKVVSEKGPPHGMDFVGDALPSGRRVRTLVVMDLLAEKHSQHMRII